MPSFILLLCKLVTTTNMIYTFITFTVCLACLPGFGQYLLQLSLLLHSDSLLQLSVFLSSSSNLHSEAKANFAHSFFSLSLSPPDFAISFLFLVSSKYLLLLNYLPYILYTNQSFLTSMNIHIQTSNCQFYTIFNSYQTSSSIFCRYIQSVSIRL